MVGIKQNRIQVLLFHVLKQHGRCLNIYMDPREVVYLQIHVCQQSEILIVNHQPKKGRDFGLDELSPEMPKAGRNELVENFR